MILGFYEAMILFTFDHQVCPFDGSVVRMITANLLYGLGLEYLDSCHA